MNEITLNHSQADLIESTAREIFFISGLGGGKTFGLGAFVRKHSMHPGSLGFIGAPSKDVLRNSTWPQIKDALNKMGLVEEVHFVVNTRPPVTWGVPPLTKLSSSRILTFVWGAYIIMDGLDNFDKLRGTEFDYMAIDEYRDVKEGMREVAIGRLRGKCFKALGIKPQIAYATTPPDNPLYLKELSKKQNDDLLFIMAPSRENEQNLPKGYYEFLLSVYDDETANREVHGLLIIAIKRQFAHKFSEKKHVKKVEINEHDEIYLSFDFNVEPMTCLVIQSDGESYINVVKEYRVPDGNTPVVCDLIMEDFGHLDPYFLVTGDATGDNRSPLTRGAQTHYQVIYEELPIKKNQVRTPNFNMSITNARILLNSMLQNFPSINIDPDGCPFLIKDLQFVQTITDRNGKVGIKKSGVDSGMNHESMTHLLDCFRYFLQTFHLDFIPSFR